MPQPEIPRLGERLRLLREVPLLGQHPTGLARLAHAATEKAFPADYTLFNAGDPGTTLYIIVVGQIRIHVGDMDLAELGPGDHLGEMSLFDGQPRSASATTLVDSVCLVLTQDLVLETLRQEPDFAVEIIRQLCQRLRRVNASLYATQVVTKA